MVMKYSPARIAVTVIAVLLAVTLFWLGVHRTSTVRITAIDDGYDIHIVTKGRSPWPLTVEGAFPEWCEFTWLTAEGSGETVQSDGVTYKKYAVGKDLQDRLNRYSGGSLMISPESKTLIVDAQLSQKSQDCDLMNQSGVYENVTIDRPAIIALAADTPIDRIDGEFVRARGHFLDKESRFEAAGMSFREYCAPYGCKVGDLYEVIGVFHARDVCGRDEPQLNIITMRKIDEPSP
jgi:hypothetical protein